MSPVCYVVVTDSVNKPSPPNALAIFPDATPTPDTYSGSDVSGPCWCAKLVIVAGL